MEREIYPGWAKILTRFCLGTCFLALSPAEASESADAWDALPEVWSRAESDAAVKGAGAMELRLLKDIRNEREKISYAAGFMQGLRSVATHPNTDWWCFCEIKKGRDFVGFVDALFVGGLKDGRLVAVRASAGSPQPQAVIWGEGSLNPPLLFKELLKVIDGKTPSIEWKSSLRQGDDVWG